MASKNRHQNAEIRLYAERKAGELLKETELSKGGRPEENPLHNDRGLESPTLKEIGISWRDSSNWQRIAELF